MKHFFFIAFLFLIPGFLQAQEISKKQIDFVNGFVSAVQEHNYKEVYKYLDKSYRKEQTKFLGGNKEQLMDELFGGTVIDGMEFVVIPISEVIKIEVVEVVGMEDGSYTYMFRVVDADLDIYADLQLVQKSKRFGFVGAVG